LVYCGYFGRALPDAVRLILNLKIVYFFIKEFYCTFSSSVAQEI